MGRSAKLASDAVTNFHTTGDNKFPDIARFAGKRASEGFFDKWVVPVVIAVVAAVVTAGIGDVVAAGVDTAVGATATTATAVSVDGSTVLTTTTLTTAGGTVLSTSASTLAADGTIVAGTTLTTSTVAGAAITVGSNTLADTAVSAALGDSPTKALVSGIIGGAIVSAIPVGATSYSPGALATKGLESLNTSASVATYVGSTLNGALENATLAKPSSGTKASAPEVQVSLAQVVQSATVKSTRAPASLPHSRYEKPLRFY